MIQCNAQPHNWNTKPQSWKPHKSFVADVVFDFYNATYSFPEHVNDQEGDAFNL